MPATTDALAGLRDIHLPEAIGLWPPAPGWWVALALFVAILAGARWLTRTRRRSLRRVALQELTYIQSRFDESSDMAALALGLATLLRRTALARYPRRSVAGLQGAEWVAFLGQSGKGNALRPDIALSIAESIYARPEEHETMDADDDAIDTRHTSWVSAIRCWIVEIT